MSTPLGNQQSKQLNKRETNYIKGIFQGVQYGSQEEAIEVASKQYAKMDWETINTINVMLAPEDDEELLTITPAMLLEAKKQIILRSIEKRNDMPKEFN